MHNQRLFRIMAPLLAALLTACGARSGGVEVASTPKPSYAVVKTAQAPAYATAEPAAAPRYATFPEDSVEVHPISEPVPDSAVLVAQFTVPDSMLSRTSAQVIAAYRPHAARLGATWITLDPNSVRRRVVAYHVPAGVRIRRALRDSASPAAVPSTGSGTVNVRGYYRRDGTYVRPHTRSRARSRGRRN